MDNLYKPTKSDRRALNLGTRKIRIHNLKADGLLEDGFCKCGTPVYKFTTKPGMLTLTGSVHKCKAQDPSRVD